MLTFRQLHRKSKSIWGGGGGGGRVNFNCVVIIKSKGLASPEHPVQYDYYQRCAYLDGKQYSRATTFSAQTNHCVGLGPVSAYKLIKGLTTSMQICSKICFLLLPAMLQLS